LDGDVVGFGTEEGGPGVMDGGAVGMVCGGADILLVVDADRDDGGARKEVPDGLSGGDVEMAAEDDDDNRDEIWDVSEMRDVPADGGLALGTNGVVGFLEVPVTGGGGVEGNVADACREPSVEIKKGEVREGLIGTGTDLLREDVDGDERNDPPGVPLIWMNELIEPDDRGPEPLGKGGRIEVAAEDGPKDNAEEDAGRDVTCITEPLDAADGTEKIPVPDGLRLVDADSLNVCDGIPLEGLTGVGHGAGDGTIELANVVLRSLGSTVAVRDDGCWELSGAADGAADGRAEDPFETVGERIGLVVRNFDDALEGCNGGTTTFPDVEIVGIFEGDVGNWDELTWVDVVNGIVEGCNGGTAKSPDVDIVGAFDDDATGAWGELAWTRLLEMENCRDWEVWIVGPFGGTREVPEDGGLCVDAGGDTVAEIGIGGSKGSFLQAP
jgi:hypothetical protein